MIDKYKLWFVSLPISSKMKIEIINTGMSYEQIFKFREKIFNNCIFYKKILEINLNNDKIYEIEARLNSNEFSLVTYEQNDYPKNLKFIDDPPFNLFYKGDISKVNKIKFIAIIGSRKASSYGEMVTRDIAYELCNQNVGIISGGAIGIDSVAHRAAIDNKIFNIAVLGCGIDVVYPKCNKFLFDEIIKNGLVISEFFPGEKPMHYNFPKRNRIISAISNGVIVCEAGIKSGATNTAFHACVQNKTIFAVPGNIYSQESKGCNALINDGALIYMDIKHVFSNLNLSYKTVKKDEKYSLKIKILKILEEKPRHIDEIIRQTKVDRSMINELLFEMQFNNDIVGLTGNNYMKILRNT